MPCSTCGKPAAQGYKRQRSGSILEMCCDPCHGPFVGHGETRAWFVRFHGRKARKLMEYRAAA